MVSSSYPKTVKRDLEAAPAPASSSTRARSRSGLRRKALPERTEALAGSQPRSETEISVASAFEEDSGRMESFEDPEPPHPTRSSIALPSQEIVVEVVGVEPTSEKRVRGLLRA